MFCPHECPFMGDGGCCNCPIYVPYRTWRDYRISEDDLISHKKENEITIEYMLKAKGLAKTNDDGVLQPTCAAVMLFAEFPTNLMKTKCAIKIMVYEEEEEIFEETPNLVKTKILTSSIITLIENAHKYVLKEIEAGLKNKTGFETEYKIPERVVKEAITNAVIHRDYHTKIDIEIKIFKNRIEICNPGLFSYNITLENIGIEDPASTRNDLLVKTLREFPKRPNLDMKEGVRAMRSLMNRGKLYPPIFKICSRLGTIPDSICVTLWYDKTEPEWEKIKEHLEIHKHINNETARKINGGGSPRRITYLFKKWVEMGILIPIHSNGSKNRLYKKG